MTPRALLLLVLLVAGCAAVKHSLAEPAPPTLGLPLGVPDDVVICVQDDPERWNCLSVGELRQIVGTLKKV